MSNKYMLRVNNSLTIIINTDYQIISSKFNKKVRASLLEKYGQIAHATSDFIKQRLTKLESFTQDEWGNYDYKYESGLGTLAENKVQFMEVSK